MTQADGPRVPPRDAVPDVLPGAQRAPKRFELPMLKRYPILAGAAAGLLLRLAFSGGSGSAWSPMAGVFIYLAPVVVGMVTVYLAEREFRRSWAYYVVAPLLATALFVFGTLLLLIEGMICAVVIVPMFAGLGAVGGLLMGAICRATRWPRHTVYGVTSLPLVLAWLASGVPLPDAVGSIERGILIDAPAEVVWQQLNHIENIREDEMSDALAARIGVPMPRSARTEHRAEGRVRVSHWRKDVHFEEVIEEWQPNRLLGWRFRFLPDSFPRGALDDHVLIGGHYFDLLDTRFTLEPEGDATRLRIATRYRISTHFNFYANWAAQLLMGDFSEQLLQLYQARSEEAASIRRPMDSAQLPLPSRDGAERIAEAATDR